MSAVLRCRFRTPRRDVGATLVGNTKATATHPVSRITRMLALAHHIERLVEGGELQSVAAASRALGLTRARLTQVMKLLLLAPEIQGQVLLGSLDWTERRLRQVVRESSWRRQIAILGRPARAARSRVNGPLKA